MFRLISLLTTILACTQYTLGSNLYGGLYAPTGLVSSGRYGHGVSRNLAIPAASVISSHGAAIVHPNSAVLQSTLGSSIPYIGHQQYISAPQTHQISSSPLVSGGLYGQSGQNGANSYAVQRSYTSPSLAASGYSGHGLYSAPIIATGNSYGGQRSYTSPLAASGYSGHGLYSAPIVASAYGGQAHGGISGHGHLSGW